MFAKHPIMTLRACQVPKIMNRLGEKLHSLRTRQRLTIRQLAPQLGVSDSYITQIELGKKTPSAKLVVKIALFFHVPLDQLMRDDLELDE
jgi:transcriptional regulator with XRE-family HTH domain